MKLRIATIVLGVLNIWLASFISVALILSYETLPASKAVTIPGLAIILFLLGGILVVRGVRGE